MTHKPVALDPPVPVLQQALRAVEEAVRITNEQASAAMAESNAALKAALDAIGGADAAYDAQAMSAAEDALRAGQAAVSQAIEQAAALIGGTSHAEQRREDR